MAIFLPQLRVGNTAALSGGNITSPDVDVSAWITALGGSQTTNTTQSEVNILTTMVQGMKTDGTWSLFDRLWLYPTGLVQAARIDLWARASHTEVNGPLFTPRKGYTGDAVSAEINTNQANNAGPNYTQNAASWGVWLQSADTTTGRAHAGATSGNNIAFLNSSATQFQFGVNQALLVGTYSTTAGLWHGVRESSSSSTLYYNGSVVATSSTGSAALNSSQFHVLSRLGLNFSASTVAAFFTAGAMTAGQAANVYSRIHTALNAISPSNFP